MNYADYMAGMQRDDDTVSSADLVSAYLQGVEDLHASVAGMTADEILQRPVAGRWSTIEVVSHLADAELTIVARDKKELRRFLKRGLDLKPIFEAKYRIKRLETFAAAKARLEDVEIKGLQQVLAADDYVIHVEIDYPDRKLQVRLYVKMNAGKPRFVGFGQEEED